VRMVDAPILEDGEYRPIAAPKVSGDLDDPYAIVPETQRQPTFSTTLPAQQP
jgi:hypothetical protein